MLGCYKFRQRKPITFQLPTVSPEPEKLTASNLMRPGPSGSLTTKETTGIQHRSHPHVDLLKLGQHCGNNASSG